ncbi:MAG: hypothetical protein RR461_08520 [Angelakisella sp.]
MATPLVGAAFVVLQSLLFWEGLLLFFYAIVLKKSVYDLTSD